jgi:hypothetical protein
VSRGERDEVPPPPPPPPPPSAPPLAPPSLSLSPFVLSPADLDLILPQPKHQTTTKKLKGTTGPQGRVAPFTFINDPSAWTAARWSQPGAIKQNLVFHLTPDESAAIVAATVAFTASGAPLTALRRPADFPLPPTITARLADARRELLHGSGVAVIRGMPLDAIEQVFGGAGDATTTNNKNPMIAAERAMLAAYLGVAAHIGAPGPQWRCGRLVTHVTNRGGSVEKNIADAAARSTHGTSTAPITEAFNRTDDFEMHNDSCCDVLGLLCIRQAQLGGGESAFASSTAVFNEMLKRGRIDAIATLSGGGFFRDKTRFHPDVNANAIVAAPSNSPVWEMPVFSWRKGYFTCAYNANLNRQVEQRYGLKLTPAQKDAMDLFDEIANAPEMKLRLLLQRGDIALINNLTVLHSRSTFKDDPLMPRHLVRTWLLARDSPHALPHRLMFPRTYSEAPQAKASTIAADTTPSLAAALHGGLMPSVLKMPAAALYVPYSNGERADDCE